MICNPHFLIPFMDCWPLVPDFPPSFRAVAQLALAPLPETWARPYRRLALSHPLEEERERRRETRVQGRQGRAPGWGAIISLFLLVVGLTAWRYGRMERFLPA